MLQMIVSEVGRTTSGSSSCLAAAVSDDGEFGREPFHVLGFFLQEALGDQEREVGVLVPGFLEHPVEGLLHAFPERISAGADDHAAFDGRVVRKFRLKDDIDIPL